MRLCNARHPQTGEICTLFPHTHGAHRWENLTQTRERDLLQLAMFMQARDARDDNGSTGVTWSDIGPIGREAYLKDAEAYLSAIEKLGYHK